MVNRKGPCVSLWWGFHMRHTLTYQMRTNSTDFRPTCTSQQCDLCVGKEVGGRENCREQRAGLLWRDRITEWLAIHDGESAGGGRGCGVKTCLCYSPQVSGRRQCAVTVPIIHFGRIKGNTQQLQLQLDMHIYCYTAESTILTFAAKQI